MIGWIKRRIALWQDVAELQDQCAYWKAIACRELDSID
jgi:hypothetical protein